MVIDNGNAVLYDDVVEEYEVIPCLQTEQSCH